MQHHPVYHNSSYLPEQYGQSNCENKFHLRRPELKENWLNGKSRVIKKITGALGKSTWRLRKSTPLFFIYTCTLIWQAHFRIRPARKVLVL